jgi:GTP cyclohydrolase I
MSVDTAAIENAIRTILAAIGEDPEREGLRDTPARVARFWREFVDYDPGEIERVFTATRRGQLVAVAGMRVWSLCEHHLLPFWCDVTIGYLPRGRVLGLSKFARVAHQHAHGLQIQERLAGQIARSIEEATGSPDVGVIVTGEHLCMTMRGIRTPGRMTTLDFRGRLDEDPTLQAHLLRLAGV